MPLFRELPRSLSGVSPGDHICCIFGSARDRLAALIPFIGQGLDRNERVLCFFEAGGESDVFEGLRSIGIDPAPFLDRGQLSIVAPGKSPPPIPPEIALAERGGWAGLRTAADNGWILASESPARCMGTFENDLGQAGRSMQPPTSLCLYDSRRFTPTLLLKALSAHPKALLGAHAAENIYHLPPEELRDEDTAGQTLRCWLKNLREHRLTHDALQNSERNYALLFNKMLNGFALMEVICDEAGAPVDLRYLEVNPAFERQSGVLAHEVIGRTFGELGAFEAAPEDTKAWIRLIGGVAIDGKPVRYEKSGEFHDRWIEGFAFSPRFGQVAIMFQDVSDRKKVERELERCRELLVNALNHPLPPRGER